MSFYAASVGLQDTFALMWICRDLKFGWEFTVHFEHTCLLHVWISNITCKCNAAWCLTFMFYIKGYLCCLSIFLNNVSFLPALACMYLLIYVIMKWHQQNTSLWKTCFVLVPCDFQHVGAVRTPNFEESLPTTGPTFSSVQHAMTTITMATHQLVHKSRSGLEEMESEGKSFFSLTSVDVLIQNLIFKGVLVKMAA